MGICTDGAAAMTGVHAGVVTKIKNVAPECKSTHSFIHRESLAAKNMSPELSDVLNEAVKVVNFKKMNALNSRLFGLLCDEMGAEHKQLLLMLKFDGSPEGRFCPEYTNYVKKYLSSSNQKKRIHQNHSIVCNGYPS